MAPHSSTLAWKIPWTEEPGRLQDPCSPWGRKESDMTERLHFHFSLSCIGGGNGNPLQCSCLENPRDGGAWWAAVYGVAQSRTRLKRLSSSSSSKLKSRDITAEKGPSSQSYSFSSKSHMDVNVGPLRRLNAKELMFFNFEAREDSQESLGLQGDQIN